MAKKKTKRNVGQQQIAATPNFFQQLRLGESYTSLVLGIVVVVILLVLVITGIRNSLPKHPTQDISSDKIEQVQQRVAKNSYTVKEGDTLWSIAEARYHSGYNWTDIAKANNLTNPGMIEKGTQLIIPKVTPMAVTATPTTVAVIQAAPLVTSPNAITGAVYVVKPSEYLWDIAVRSYGDGYRWMDIARANNVSGPEYIIYKDDRLTIPR